MVRSGTATVSDMSRFLIGQNPTVTAAPRKSDGKFPQKERENLTRFCRPIKR
jgi:hypothetical protein